MDVMGVFVRGSPGVEELFAFISADLAHDENSVDDQAGNNQLKKIMPQDQRHDLPQWNTIQVIFRKS